jgi:hypothetical protein
VTLVIGRAAGDPSSWAGHPVVVPISRRVVTMALPVASTTA